MVAAHLREGGAGAPQTFELEEWSIAQLQDAMRSGQLTSQRITQAYLGRIEALDRRGPALRQVLETSPNALAAAAQLDGERRAGRVRGPLHGVPVLVKDNIDTRADDGMHTSAGSLALAASAPARDAFLVDRLRAAGAVILGKTNLSEWANIRSSRSSSGWSARGGQGKNPYALDRTTCGSSSGTAAAVAASYAAVGVGTETDGSIVCPSGATAVVGIKPTLGLISRGGIIPIAHSQDTAGPMARSVADAATLLGAMTGEDARDPATRQSRGQARTDYTSFLDAGGLRGARIGVARRKVTGYSVHADVLYENALSALADAGAVLVDPADIPHLGDYDDTEWTVLLHELKAGLNAYLAAAIADGARPAVRTLAELIEFNEANAATEMPWFGQELFHAAQAKGPLTERPYREALAHNQRLARAEGIDAVMDRHRLDAIVAPTGSPPWPVDLLNGDHITGSSSTPAAVSGYPTITVPMGFVNELPVGLTLIGRAWSEGTLIKLAFAYEQATRHRRAPKYLPTAPFPGFTV